jgi:hypothetical protein
MVDQTRASWNWITDWLRKIGGLQEAASREQVNPAALR